MNEQIKNLRGSPKRDIFKWAHKNKMNAPSFYASDCDLCIISFNPRGVIAYIDYKGSGESVTSTEQVLYDEWAKTKPVFIIEGRDPENGPFNVYRYCVGSNPEFICCINDWYEFMKWETVLREEYKNSDSDFR